MFKNPGEKIKIVAKVIFWITVIAAVIAAFVLGFDTYYSYYGSGFDFEPLYFFGLLIGYPMLAYIVTLFFVAFGDLVQNSQSIKDSAKKIENIPECKTTEETKKEIIEELPEL